MAQVEVSNGAAAEKSLVSFSACMTQLTVEAHKVGDAVSFYKSVFGAVESGHSLYPKRKADQELPHLLSAELQLAGSTVLVCDVSSDSTAKTEGNKMTTLHLVTDDVEAAVAKAVDAGAVKAGEVSEVDGGGKRGKVTDPFGVAWIFSSPAIKTTEKDENKEF
ncbi:unnamed protein product [Arabis nemorensis]|uniref:Uncharacterized protein n=1 Tax=Arabis nemorensis TaxID=586526 RepID=A0A565CPM5_9BRAS|nr:unnamed protein product [Arabis nemorensis]